MIAVFSSEIILYQNSNHITDDCQVLFEVFFLIDEWLNEWMRKYEEYVSYLMSADSVISRRPVSVAEYPFCPPRYCYRGADKSLARPGKKQVTTEYFEFHVSCL